MKSPLKKRSSRATKRTSTRPRSSGRRSRPRKRRSTRARRLVRTVYLGLGSNLGDRAANLRAALTEIARLAPVRRVSSFYLSEPVGPPAQPAFFNAVAEIAWSGTPSSLLTALKRIERRLGRVATFRHGPRRIDIDVLDLGGLVRVRRDLVLPHPGVPRRRFVLAPLRQIAQGWRHPITGQTAAQMLAELPRRPWVRKLGEREP